MKPPLIKFKFLFITALLLPILTIAQQKYFPYKYNENYGLTSEDGKETIEGNFIKYNDYNYIKGQAFFKDANKKDVLINLETGERQVFDELKPNVFYCEDEYFSIAKVGKENYFFGNKSGTKLKLPPFIKKENLDDLKMINHRFLYIVVKEKEVVKKKKTTQSNSNFNKILKAEPEPKDVFYLYVLENKKTLTQINKVKITADWLDSFELNFHFYNYRKTPKQKDGEVKTKETEIIKIQENKTTDLLPWHFYYEEDFDIVSFNINDNLFIFDSDLKLLKTIKSVENERDSVEKYLTDKYPNDEVEIDNANFYPIPMLGQVMKPFWNIRENVDYSTLTYYKNEKEIPFLNFKGTVDKYDQNELIFTDINGNKLTVFMNLKNMNFIVPEKFKNQFGLEIIR
ncbi:hypothetical protein [Flavobacterium sp. I3-2]|uniref:hypothetical protein n=1 Tax=Flavobacterium sp. I3-2 TaxID=2748319 RepID=UPI0015ACA0FD|nr:hypothetical protein [Flavobacterium sp. I3-2]